MGTTRIKVIDLSSEKQEIKTARKHAEKLSGISKLTAKKKPKEERTPKGITESTEPIPENTESHVTADSSVPSEPSVPSVITKQSAPSTAARTSQRHTGKKYQQAKSQIDSSKTYSASNAIDLLNKISTTKFDPTVEIHLNVADKNIKGSVNLPHPVGKKKEKKYLVFSDKQSTINDKRIIWGDEKTIDEIQNGKLRPGRDFDQVIAQPKFMAQLVKVAKILGPRGMMPNPKNKTVTENPQSAIEKQINSPDTYEYKTDPTAPVIHLVLGKLSEKPDHLQENLKTIVSAIGPTKIKRAVIKSTMSPAIKVDVSIFTS